TLTEGFYARMGGFDIGLRDGHRETVVTLERIIELEDKRQIARSTTFTFQINDKSKADTFSKLITLTQVMWFVLQCCARTAQHLPLSILEVGTLGYVAITVILYLVWFYKPKDV
ncbi:hypothetical protein CERSUDRAFT_25736, partial [Gelatoporia subvermispora B]